MERVVQYSVARQLVRVTPDPTGGTAPGATPAGATDVAVTPPTGTGIYALDESLNPLLSGYAGVSRQVELVPGAVSSGTYTFYVFGLIRVGQTTPVWLPILLWRGTAACTNAMAGTPSAEALNTGEFGAATITSGAGVDATTCQINSPSTSGYGSVLIDTRGCPYLKIMTSDAAAFALLGGKS